MFKLYIITASYLGDKFQKKRINFNFYKTKKIKVINLNISSIQNPIYYKILKNKIARNSTIINKNNIEFFFKKIKKTDKVICMEQPTINNELIYKTLNKARIKYSLLYMGGVPNAKKKKFYEFLHVLIKYNLKIIKTFFHNPKAFFNFILLIFYTKKITLKPQYFFYAGNSYYSYYKNYFLRTRFISVPTPEYDQFIIKGRKKKNLNIKNFNSAVFISGLRNSNDNKSTLSYKFSSNIISKKDYYAPITNFLKDFKQVSNLNIIISKHPREIHNNNFYKFGKLRSDTLNSVRNSNFVIVQSSTAISYAVLYKKPILFLTNNNFSHNTIRQIKVLSEYFEKKPFNVTRDKFTLERFNEEKKINHKLYNSYIKDFITNKRESLTSYEKIFNYLNNTN